MFDERNFDFWRRSLFILNVFYMALGLIFLFVAIFIRLNSLIVDLHLFIGLIILSIYLLALSIFGIYAIIKHHQVFLFFYMVMLMILFLFQFILACTFLTIRDGKKYDLLKKNYQYSYEHIQEKYNCCGFDNSTNGNRSDLCHSLSCCRTTIDCCQSLPMCYPLLNNELNKNLKIVGSFTLIFTLTQIIAIYMTLRFRNIRNPAIFIECDT